MLQNIYINEILRAINTQWLSLYKGQGHLLERLSSG